MVRGQTGRKPQLKWKCLNIWKPWDKFSLMTSDFWKIIENYIFLVTCDLTSVKNCFIRWSWGQRWLCPATWGCGWHSSSGCSGQALVWLSGLNLQKFVKIYFQWKYFMYPVNHCNRFFSKNISIVYNHKKQ